MMPKPSYSNIISKELNISAHQVTVVSALLEEAATIPFISRYRKEATGNLDEVSVTAIRDRLHQLHELEKRRESILNSLEKQGKLSDELRQKVIDAATMAMLEDIYLPYKPKRRTKAVMAREKGLEPLAERIFSQQGVDPIKEAAHFVDVEKGVETVEEALAGARDIIAEKVCENEQVRAAMRDLFFKSATVKSRVTPGKEEEGAKFKDYFDWDEPIANIPSHRLLAMRRGEKEEILFLDMVPDQDTALSLMEGFVSLGDGKDSQQVKMAVTDGYKRLLSNTMETEARLHTKEKADGEAIGVFAENLRQLLLAPPLGAKRVMGIDPGFRTGCKVVCLDRQGMLLHNDTIYPHMSSKKALEDAGKIQQLCRQFQVEAVAVGNGTAGRETEAFFRSIDLPGAPQVVMVNESGASVYSASTAAREEFPDHDLTVRGAVSIGRRLMDPLAELVKIDPKSIGVGQYQHDVDQTALKQALDDVVMSCVNSVGVDLNRASAQLLAYVSGLNTGIARNIVHHRDVNGPFEDRQALLNVPRLGPKAFEQAAGFLRIPDGTNPLDASAVHPESYAVVDAMANDLQASVADLMKQAELRQQIDIARYVTETVGLPTLNDILTELAKPGRDPRKTFEVFSFAEGIDTIENLRPGMKLPGIVTNITAFGAFVDIGVHQDGLVHISQMADKFVKNPADIVSVGQKVAVSVLDIDLKRKRISLSLKKKETGEKKETGKRGAKSTDPAGKDTPLNRRRKGKTSPGQKKRKQAPVHQGALAEALKKSGIR